MPNGQRGATPSSNPQIFMDDPLVDLDLDRQLKAADSIKDFAENKQLFLLTCHPAHAKMLGGNKIELSIEVYH
jgi:uncharacterized protein YhaN